MPSVGASPLNVSVSIRRATVYSSVPAIVAAVLGAVSVIAGAGRNLVIQVLRHPGLRFITSADRYHFISANLDRSLRCAEFVLRVVLYSFAGLFFLCLIFNAIILRGVVILAATKFIHLLAITEVSLYVIADWIVAIKIAELLQLSTFAEVFAGSISLAVAQVVQFHIKAELLRRVIRCCAAYSLVELGLHVTAFQGDNAVLVAHNLAACATCSILYGTLDSAPAYDIVAVVCCIFNGSAAFTVIAIQRLKPIFQRKLGTRQFISGLAVFSILSVFTVPAVLSILAVFTVLAIRPVLTVGTVFSVGAVCGRGAHFLPHAVGAEVYGCLVLHVDHVAGIVRSTLAQVFELGDRSRASGFGDVGSFVTAGRKKSCRRQSKGR